MLLNELLARIPEFEHVEVPGIPIRGISYDSRRVAAGSLFVAIKGETADGGQYIPQAIERGAAAVVSEADVAAAPPVAALKVADARKFLAQASRVFYRDPAAELTLVAITGTNGKTTTTYLVDSIFRQAGLRSCLIGTTGMKIGSSEFSSERTTPEAPDLSLFLRHAVMAGCTHGVLEVSSHALSLKRVYGTKFAVGIFTNLTQDHLDFHRDMESYYRAKRLLFVKDGENRIVTAVINTDDPYGARLSVEAPGPVLSFGFGAGSAIRGLDLRSGIHGMNLRVSAPQGEMALRSLLIGRPNAYNMLAAAAAAISLGVDFDSICGGIEALPGVPGRMERVDAGQPFLTIVDYAHTPHALENLLETLIPLKQRNLITVFGCGGDRDRGKRSMMGEIAAGKSDIVIATSDNPRSEDPLSILADIEAGLRRGSAKYRLVANRREAIGEAISNARAGDVVVIAGKGHETYQIIGTQALAFDDRAVAREFLVQGSNAGGVYNLR